MLNINFMEKQKHLFEILKSRISCRQRLSDVIEELLGLSADSAYRRIRGETELSFSELNKICNKFNLSMDDILNYKSSQGILFYYVSLLQIINTLKSDSDKEIISIARSIPFYYSGIFPELAYMSLYSWNNAMNCTKTSYNAFVNNLDKEEIKSIYSQVYCTFNSTPSKEIWNVQTIDHALRILDYYFAVGAFEKKDTILHLLNQLSDLMDKVNQYAEDGHKGGEQKTPFYMYDCSVDLDSNSTILIKGDLLFLYLRLNMFNFIETNNELFCDTALRWNNYLISKSIQISGISSAKQRYCFFESAKNKIEGLVNKIKNS